MKPSTRILVLVSTLALLGVYVFPLWRYDLGAPQYPEGLTLSVWVNRIGGQLKLVNQLNHYIGMKSIEPDAIAELRAMPWIVAAVAIAGAAVAALGRRVWLYGWFAVFALLGIAGIVDFYLWLYDYGHSLNPEAPFQLPPFTPPLFGTNVLANFEVSSYPDVGGWAAFGAGFLALIAVVLEWRGRQDAAA